MRVLVAFLSAAGAMFLVMFGHNELALVGVGIGEILVGWGDA